jgi:type 2 lantibiotic biosynthesis protein LanM
MVMENTPSLVDTEQRFIQHKEYVAWGQALTLNERLALLRSSRPPLLNEKEQQVAQKRLTRWKEQGSFKGSELFAERLAFDGLGEQELLLLLGASSDKICGEAEDKGLPGWIQAIEQALGNKDTGEGRRVSSPVELFQPLVMSGIHKIMGGLKELAQRGQNFHCELEAVFPGLIADVAARIENASSRALVLELNIARLQGQLEGNNGEERQASFWQRLSQREHFRTFLQEYPVLARYLITLIDEWADYSLEFMGHLSADWEMIGQKFAQGTDPGPLVEIKAGAGDVHNNGRSVALLRFKEGLQLVYKPRPLQLDIHFQELLAWVNAQKIGAQLQTIEVLEGDSYGWCEFVEAHGCGTESEIERFYERLGSYVALLYLLDAADFHYENLLAVGEQPILTDLESLFHARLAEETYDRVLHSVLRIGLLPERDFKKNESHGADLSGIGGGQAGKMTPMPVMVLRDVGTDQAHMSREYIEMKPTLNRPTLNGEGVDVQKYTQDILRGFTQTYRMLVEQRETLEKEILPKFARDEVRIIVRPTSAYGAYLYGSLHTDCLQNALERDQILDRLWDMVPERPYLKQFLQAERKDLLKGDIPAFRTLPGGREIFTYQGEQLEASCIEPAMDFVRRRLAQMGEEDLARQRWVIQGSLATMLMDSNEQHAIELREAEFPSKKQLLEEACKLGDRLSHLALWNEGKVNWLGITMDGDQQGNFFWNLQAADSRLYDGTSGIALFLAYLGAISGEGKYTELAQSTLETVRQQLWLEHYTKPGSMSTIGAFTGLGSYIYLFSHLAVLWQDERYLHEAEEALALIEVRLEQDQKLDMIAGSAGCLSSLLSFYAVAPSERVMKVALRCGDHLRAQAKEVNGGLGWLMAPEYPALAGFSHGVAGVVYSLARLAAASGERRFLATIQGGLSYERFLYSKEEKNWPYLAKDAEGKIIGRMQTTWCHGAPGIGLGRLGMMGLIEDTEMYQEIDAALETTVRQGFGHNQCLCHGDLGNLESLLVASQKLKRADYQSIYKRVSGSVFDGIQRCGWVTGVPQGVETPGLMVGLAGIGYQLLRLAEPERVPSVLLLETPPKAMAR